jgi:hypothetical protein
MIQAGGDRLTEVAERERSGQCRGAIDCLAFVVRVADDDVHVRLNRAKLAYEGSDLDEYPGNNDVDAYSARDFDRLERILCAQDTMAGLTQYLIDQLQDCRVFLDDKDSRGLYEMHTARLPGDERQRQTQMGRLARDRLGLVVHLLTGLGVGVRRPRGSLRCLIDMQEPALHVVQARRHNEAVDQRHVEVLQLIAHAPHIGPRVRRRSTARRGSRLPARFAVAELAQQRSSNALDIR